VLLYGSESWFLTEREENRPRVFDSRLLTKIFGPKRNEVMGGWRQLHNEELYDLYSAPSIITIIKLSRMRWVGHEVQVGEKRNMYRLMAGKAEGKGPLQSQDVGGWITLRWIL
jgi:hypothetical protein